MIHSLRYIAIICLMLFTFSCERNFTQDQPLADGKLTLTYAKEWFEANYNTENGSRKKGDGFWSAITPEWEKGRKNKDGDDCLIIPLKHGSFRWRKQYVDPVSKKGQFLMLEAPPMNMLVYKDKKGNMKALITQFDGDVINRTSGYLLYREWGGKITSFARVEKGAIKHRYFKVTNGKKDKSARSCFGQTVYLCYYQGEDCWDSNGAVGHNEVSLSPCQPVIYSSPMESCFSYVLNSQDEGPADQYLTDCPDGDGDVPPNPGGEGQGDGNANYDIKDDQLAPCVKNISSDLLMMTNGENGSINAIFHIFGTRPNYNWNLTDGRLPLGTSGTTGGYDRGTKSVTTVFDSHQYAESSDLSVARTIIHESIHAYLVNYFAVDPLAARSDFAKLLYDYTYGKHPSDLNYAHHEEIARNYVKAIADALIEFDFRRGHSKPRQIYEDLAWGGLDGTTTFDSLSVSVQSRIRNSLLVEFTGKDLSGNVQPQSGRKLDCP